MWWFRRWGHGWGWKTGLTRVSTSTGWHSANQSKFDVFHQVCGGDVEALPNIGSNIVNTLSCKGLLVPLAYLSYLEDMHFHGMDNKGKNIIV